MLKMNAIRVEKFGGPEVLRISETARPLPRAGQVLVRLHAAGVNPVETYIRSGEYAKLPTLPYTPGTDGAGRIESIGPEVEGFQTGERVYVAGSLTGTYAELCLCEAKHVHPLPAEMGFAEGASLGVPYATAWHALHDRARIEKGETVLIHGGTGGVGIASIQIAKEAGLVVFATGGTESGRLVLIEQGAEAAFDHHASGYLEAILSRTGGRGVDAIIEMLANVNLGKDLVLLAPGGRVAVVGSRGAVEINPRDAMTRESDIRGVMLSSVAEGRLAEIHRHLGEGLSRGVYRPVIGKQFPLRLASEAHEEVRTPGAHGKVVLLL